MRNKLMTKIAAVAAAAVVSFAAIPSSMPCTYAAEDEYTYVYAGLTWHEYWENEDVYNAADTDSSDTVDTKGEYDCGAFDAVTRATTNHGLHRGSFQCIAIITTTDGNTYNVAGWTADGSQLKLTNGASVGYTKGTITNSDGTTSTLEKYVVTGLKYVPVKVKTSDLSDFKTKYTVVENGGKLFGGYSEKNLKAYEVTAEVDANTNGLKTATKNSDGTYSFSKAATGTGSGIKDQSIKTVSDSSVTITVKDADGAYGEFLRVDITGDYGDLGSNMQAVTWTYYGSDSTRTTALATYGTKFAADNWMHKSNGIQLGLTDSARCQLPEGTDGTGYWTITVKALGYDDYSFNFEATSANIVVEKAAVSDTSKIEAAIASADALTESDYTAESWALMKAEYDEAVEALNTASYQADIDEATSHLTAAIEALVKAASTEDTTDSSTGSESTSAEDTTDTTASAQTGDSMSVTLYAALAAAALAVCKSTARKKRSLR